MTLDVPRTEPHLSEARRRLEHARSTRLAQLRALDETGHTSEDYLLSEQKTAMERTLKEIDKAFARIENGSYGTCLDCARPIPAERLEILPYTRLCVACQRRTT
ncbi:MULTISPECIES: TraR/DksA C4-type zinc finger protein [Streptomyces]|uniref:TraR/DksA C4-type zinc finger protein n=1 Tax=Streptomyces gilvifuscus TaxID=1550617 RepID=A0ABT5G441_9ACTN|nr:MULTISPECIES: TraR/DksA C4-type zinc finger protein [Streptomyces]MBK3639841.1 TraR/DksA C4-type zinc finger protein [Streptomyces sp. MBT33]MDC2959493.1 TraR/DksA C4-type zinc finger protein [Streptomyces gilvifuscus]